MAQPISMNLAGNAILDSSGVLPDLCTAYQWAKNLQNRCYKPNALKTLNCYL